MRNTMNIYKRKDGRFEGRIPFGRDDNGNLKYRYLYSRSLAQLKEKMLSAYATSEKYKNIWKTSLRCWCRTAFWRACAARAAAT